MEKRYVSPAIEVLRFESEEVLNPLIASGVGSEDVPAAGGFDFDDNGIEGLF